MSLLDWIPNWLAIGFAAAVIFAAWWFLGWKGALLALASVLTFGAYRRGRKTGSAEAIARQDKINQEAVRDYDGIQADTDGMSDAELDAANRPWVRRQSKR